MKSLFVVHVVLLVLLASCTGGRYHMSHQERSSQKGYHANTANKIVNENQKNKAANQKASEKNRQKINEAAATKTSSGKKPLKHSGVYKFYVH
jgi:hypothetical protein